MKTGSLKIIILILFFAAYATAQKTFYFLPPNDPDWIKKTPHIICTDNGTITAMDFDPATCGWYKVVFPSGYKMNCDVVIWQGYINNVQDAIKDTKTDRIGVNGLEEGPEDWDEVMHMPKFIRFETQFNKLGNPPTIYFDAAKGAKDGWTSVQPPYDPTQSNRCSYKMSGLLYDTDASVNPSFTEYSDGTNGGTGIRKGIVKPTLDVTKTPPKMAWYGYNQYNGSNASWKSEEQFNQAFNCTQGKNALVCYDMPFKRDTKGLWTFNSDFLCDDGTLDLRDANISNVVSSLCKSTGRKPHLAFVPDRLYGSNRGKDDTTPLDSRCTYKNCPNCAKTYGAESLRPVKTENQFCYEKALSGSGTSCGWPFNDGQFTSDGDPAIWGGNWGVYNSYMASTNLNSFFCFESHAVFTYEKGQKFYFSGDDDIWVFINNDLVIDLGGCHLAAPGYVDLDSIGKLGSRWAGSYGVSNNGLKPAYDTLIPGKEYPIDIFFCDRRTTMSNIRVSTNMYISQKNGLFVKDGNGTTVPAKVCMTQEGGGTCAALLSGTQELCEGKVAPYIEYYITPRRADTTIFLTKADPTTGVIHPVNPDNCVISAANPSELVCYGGIFINMANGSARVDKGKVVGLPGTWYLYAKVTDAKAQTMSSVPADIKIATFLAEVVIKMVYGDIRGNKNALITDICKSKDLVAVTGELKPVCFSDGTTIDPEEVAGTTFALNQAGITNDLGNKLKIYLDSNGTFPVGRLDTMFSIPGKNVSGVSGTAPMPGSGSVDGVLVLWVTGDYKQNEQGFKYKINVRGRPETEAVTLTSIVPELQWVRKPKPDSLVIIPDAEAKGSKFDADGKVVRTEDGKPEPVFIREQINLYMRAYNPRTGATCRTCEFDLSDYKAFAYGSDTLREKDKNLVDVSGLKIVNGEANISIAGKIDLVQEFPRPYYAKLTINGSSELQTASWDSLQFKAPPVPVPVNTTLFDRDGDGIGDSLVIIYNRGFKRDSLPNMIEVFWGSDTTRYGIGKYSEIDGERVYTAEGIDTAANFKYWEKYLRLDKNSKDLRARGNLGTAIKDLQDTIMLVLDSAGQQRASFSKKVLTKSEGKIYSWASFLLEKTPGGPKVPYNRNFMTSIDEKIPAIVIAAKYVADTEIGCGTNSLNPCTDRLTIEFSEPVFADPAISLGDDEAKNPFAYRLSALLGEREFKILGPASLSQQKIMKFKSSNKEGRPGEDGDSIVYLNFDRWRDVGGSSGTPMPGDSVKFAVMGKYGLAKNLLVDVNGNAPNPNEIGRQIEGRNPFMQEKIAIGEIDPNSDRTRLDVYDVLVNHVHSAYPDAVINKMYTRDRPVEILPVPPEWTIKEVMSNYKGTIGLLFNPDVFNALLDLDPTGKKIPDGAIVFYAKTFYHTNLGNYVAGRNFSIKCNNPIFPLSEKTGEPSCRENRNKIYVAWNMKDFNGRFVGTGAYVSLYDFHWEINVPDAEKVKMESIDRKVEMHGVKRVKRR